MSSRTDLFAPKSRDQYVACCHVYLASSSRNTRMHFVILYFVFPFATILTQAGLQQDNSVSWGFPFLKKFPVSKLLRAACLNGLCSSSVARPFVITREVTHCALLLLMMFVLRGLYPPRTSALQKMDLEVLHPFHSADLVCSNFRLFGLLKQFRGSENDGLSQKCVRPFPVEASKK